MNHIDLMYLFAGVVVAFCVIGECVAQAGIHQQVNREKKWDEKMNTNYQRRMERVENMLDFLKLVYSKSKDLFNNECHYYVFVGDDNEVEIIVRKPGLNYPALTWNHSDFIFNGSMDELQEFIENLQPSNKVVPIR